jgi:superkiller protein 3
VKKTSGFITLLSLFLCVSSVSAAPEAAMELITAGRKLLDQGKIDAAIIEFQKAAAVDPKNGATLLNLGHAYERAGRSDEAIDAYRKSIELEPRNFFARNNLGVLYDNQGKYDQAIAELQDALHNEPNNATALKNLETAKKNKAVVQQRNEQISRAEKEIEAKPQDPIPAYQLARLYAAHSKKEAAIEWLGKAIQLGYKDLSHVKADPAFVGIRDEREFQLLLLKK